MPTTGKFRNRKTGGYQGVGGGGKRKGKLLLNRYTVSVWGEEK